MTKISNQYSLTNILTADLANSRLGINNVSPTVALDVTGAGKFSSSVTATQGIFTDGTQGLVVRAFTGASGFGAIYPSTVTPSNTNHAIAASSGATILNTGASGIIDLEINTTSALYINNSRNIGIGTTSPTALLHIGYVAGTNGLKVESNNTPITWGGNATYGEFGTLTWDTGVAIMAGVTGKGIAFHTNGYGTERMRITSGGEMLVGRTTGGLSNGTGITLSGGSVQAEANSYLFYGNRTSSDGLFMGIRRNNADVGSITVTTSATAFNTSSDYRLKTDFKDYNGLSLINSIKTYDYAWAIDNTRSYGVKAHELQELLPYMVFGEKDAINEDNSIKPQAVDYSKLVPVLVKAIQELSAKVSLLENK